MPIGTRRCLAISCLISALQLWVLSDVESAVAEDGTDPVATELAKLRAEYQEVQREWVRALPPDGAKTSDREVSDEEWLRAGRQAEAGVADPDSQLLPRYLALAKAHPQSPYSLDALAFVIMRGGYHTGDVHGEPWRLKEQALDLLASHHLASSRVVHVFTLVSGSLPSQKSESFLRQAFETGPNSTTRAAAGFSLAQYFHNLGKAHARTRQIRSQSRVANNERFWKLVVAPYLDEQFPYDEAKASAEIDRILTRVIASYSDIQATDWTWSGPNNEFLKSKAFSQPKTYGDLAKALLLERSRLAPGKRVPEIAGTDAAGSRFCLSDYRGKVVLLTFSANWCGACIELYPLQRNLIEKFHDQPFVLLSVSMDESLDTLKSSTASGDIAWRCWWDGMEGPIRQAWNISSAPTVYLLDQQGIVQDVRLGRTTPQEEFERAISSLLTKVPAADRPGR